MKKNKIELLAPAGNLEKLKTALAFGADAVYAGIPDFSLRVRINDFDIEKIAEATEYCHKMGKKIYITVNIFAHNQHLDKLPKYIKKLKQIGVDALIVSDPGVMAVVKEIWSDCEIHLSTQANCTNWQSVKFWHQAGAKRIILGREVTLEEIKEIHKKFPKIELEYFVHGAMCMAYSGRCFLSKYFVDRSGNLGDCVQPCRWNYFISEEKRPGMPLELVEEQHGSYILNAKDMCLIKHLKELKDAGIVSFKIEGRAKSAYYQGLAAGIYRQAIDIIESDLPDKKQKQEINKLYNELENTLVHRGYTTGFLLGEKADQALDESHTKCEWQFCGQAVRSEKVGKKYLNYIKIHNAIKVGDNVEVVMPIHEVEKIKIKKILDSKTKEALEEVHGGQEKIAILENDFAIPEFSVLRRKVMIGN